MQQCRTPAPAVPRGSAGALFFLRAFLLVALPIAACGGGEEPPEPHVLVLGGDTIVLPDSIGLVTIEVGRHEDGMNRFEPASASVSTGDVVRFLSLDNGTHAIAFDAVTLAPEARTHLEQNGQLRSPPLLVKDAVWVVNLQGAPPGAYDFSCATHGERGTLTVAPRG